MRPPLRPGKQIASPQATASRPAISPSPCGKDPAGRPCAPRAGLPCPPGARRGPVACGVAGVGVGNLDVIGEWLDDGELEETTSDALLSTCRCLVLDVSCQPVGVLGWKRAVLLDVMKKAEVLEYHDVCVRSVSMRHPIPAVVRAQAVLKHRGRARVALNRTTVHLRDDGRCVYCGSRSNLTIDHVVPISKGGPKAWGNVVTACMRCNNKKGDRTLKQMGWKLKKEPNEPSPFDVRFVLMAGGTRERPRQWANYLQGLVGMKM
ncbi:unnamed protein product [Ostreobium quekettii]|uniref:HNH nuclease domain-containing protein n=1 Tax=Ostreobium quekettii TaxID=121088 RepID=A0A8S1IRP1_9CHLO|nr:unnamed protein product [Ostreobium quekettii]